MRIEDPCRWVQRRIEERRPFFTVRINDGEMVQMFRTRPEGSLLGTDANPAYTHYALGDAYLRMLEEMAASGRRDDILLGCSWNTERADDMGRGPFADTVRRLDMEDWQWCNEHWPLDGVVNGSTIAMLDLLRKEDGIAALVTCDRLADACQCIAATWIEVQPEDSWLVRDQVYARCERAIRNDLTHFVWAAGGGLKPTAWKLWQNYPRSSHIDIGHLFNGAFGLRDYGWLQRQDGPWYEPYFRDFVPWFQKFIP